MLEGKNLTKRYGGREVLSSVSLQLEPGQCLGLIGSNGSGKSTLIAILAQTIEADGGELLLDGRCVKGDKRFLRSRLGYLPQQPALLGELKVKEQLKFWQRNQKLRNGLSKELEELLGIRELEGQRISYLSGGQQRRVSLALALMGEPDYLLMDEPCSALDAAYRQELLQWIANYCKQGKAVLWCSHDREELEGLCEKSVGLDHGQIAAQGSTAAVLQAMQGVMV